MNVLLDVPDTIITDLDRRVAENRLNRALDAKLTAEQELEVRRIADSKGVGAAQDYLKQLSSQRPATSRRKLLLQIIDIGYRHISELPAPADTRTRKKPRKASA